MFKSFSSGPSGNTRGWSDTQSWTWIQIQLHHSFREVNVVNAHSFLDGSFKQDQPKQHLLFICVLINSCWTNYCMTALMSSQSDGKDLRCFLRGFFFLKVVTCNLFHLYAYEICWRFGPNGREPDRICIKLPPSALFKLLHELQWYHSRGCRFVLGKKNPPRLWWVKT